MLKSISVIILNLPGAMCLLVLFLNLPGSIVYRFYF